MATRMLSLSGAAQGRASSAFGAGQGLGIVQRGAHDLRQASKTSGVIRDRVVLKSGAVEVPFPGAKVLLLRMQDAYRAWMGDSDAEGYYTATGLEVGTTYFAVAIDRDGNHKVTGAGPVLAQEPTE